MPRMVALGECQSIRDIRLGQRLRAGAGPLDKNPFIHIPAGVLNTLRNPAINWIYPGVGSPGLNGRAVNHARGKTLGCAD